MVWSLKFFGNTTYHQLQKAVRKQYPENRNKENPSRRGNRKVVDAEGRLVLPEAYRKRWGLTRGTELVVQETPEGMLIRPLDPPLKKIYVEPTSRCNLDCRTCVRNSWNEPSGTMDFKHFQRLVGELHTVPSLEKIAFWGIGEPLLHPNILEMIAAAKHLGARTELVTNALLLDPDMADGLIGAGLDLLVVSVDGVSAESYACIRSSGNLDVVIRNIRHLNLLRSKTGNGLPQIGVEFVAMRRNLSELPKLRDLAYELSADLIIVSNLLPYTESLKDEILYWWSACKSCFTSPDRSPEYPEVVLPLMDDRPEQIAAITGLLRSNGIVNPVLKDFGFIPAFCPFVWEGSASISWDGSVSPCVALMHSYTCFVLGREKKIRRYPLGNIAREGFMPVWNSNEYRQFRNRVMRFEFSPCVNCGGCEFADFNEEDCFGNSFPVCGDCLWARGVILCP